MRKSTELLVEFLRKIAADGKTLAQAAAETGLSYHYVARISNERDISFARQKMADRPVNRARATDMRRRYEDGQTLEAIGRQYGLTRERVRQIMTGRFGTTHKDGGQAELARRNRRDFHKKRDARMMTRWGCTYKQYISILKRPDKPTYSFSQQRKNSDIRKIGWELSLWQWWQIWQQSGHWSERGVGRDRYGMCRLNDCGPYAVDNVYIGTTTENMKDYWVNKRAAVFLEAAQ